MSGKVTAEMVKELRERTGVGMAKCKEALDKVGGDMEQAIDFLRKTGMASAVKKEGRETNEGTIGAHETAHALALVEVNAETDFVVQNEKFKEFVKEIAHYVAETKPASLDALMQKPFSKDASITWDQHRALVIQSLGENIQVKRILVIPKTSDQSFGIYSHMGGKIIAVVELEGGAGFESLARDIAMHTAAEAPECLRPEEVPAELKAREEEVARSQVQGKPENMIAKIVEGKMKAFFDQVCLLQQKFIKDNSISIADLVEQEAKKAGKPLKIRKFIRWKVGQ